MFIIIGPQALLDPNYEFYKIGRTGNLARRLMEWSKQCGYRPRIIECFPNEDTRSTVVQRNTPSPLSPSKVVSTTTTTRSRAGKFKSKLSYNSDSEWEEKDDEDEGKNDTSRSLAVSSTERNNNNHSNNNNDDDAEYEEHPKSPFSHRLERLIHLELMEQYKFSGISCQGCQTVHQEWFKIPRQSTISNDNDTSQTTTTTSSSSRSAWPSIRQVVVRWTRYVDTLASSSSSSS
jgi:hypothetical protein